MSDQPLRVLVVDDNHDNADIVSQYLESTRDFIVSVAYDGDEALRRFGEQRPDLVLLDVVMPGVDGWEVCRTMKSDPAHADETRVIMVTARDDLSDKRTALQTGADDFLEKPLDLSRLLATVRRNAAMLKSRRLATADPDAPDDAAGSGNPGTPASRA